MGETKREPPHRCSLPKSLSPLAYTPVSLALARPFQLETTAARFAQALRTCALTAVP